MPRLVTLSLLTVCSLNLACNIGVIPRDLPPPEAAPPPEGEPAEPAEPAPSQQPPSTVVYKLDGNRLELPGPITFQANSDTLDPGSDPALEHIRLYMDEKAAISTLRIEGHADDQALSERRALAVGRWLIAHGIECRRLLAVGFGANKPLADASTPEGRAQNTRIELHNAALLDRPIGGMPPDGGGRIAGELCQ